MKKFIFFITLLTLITLIAPIVSHRILAIGGTLKPGWNIITWQSNWPLTTYSSLPVGCDQLAVKKNGWFESWVRDYSTTKAFEIGKNYYVRCSSTTPWTF